MNKMNKINYDELCENCGNIIKGSSIINNNKCEKCDSNNYSHLPIGESSLFKKEDLNDEEHIKERLYIKHMKKINAKQDHKDQMKLKAELEIKRKEQEEQKIIDEFKNNINQHRKKHGNNLMGFLIYIIKRYDFNSTRTEIDCKDNIIHLSLKKWGDFLTDMDFEYEF